MSYLYASNIDPLDRRTQLEIQLDNGTTAVLRMGHFYELTAGELARARRYIVLTASTTSPDEEPIGIVYLPIKGNPTAGEVPVWEANEGVFVPGAGGGGGGGGTATSVSFTPTGTVAATNVQAAIAEVASEAGAGGTGLTNHLADTSDAHDASAISFVPTGTIAATTVQTAIVEVAIEAGAIAGSTIATALSPDGHYWEVTADNTGVLITTDIGTAGTQGGPPYATEAEIAAHLADAIAAHAASAISFAPTGTIAATTVQAAIAEVAIEASGGGGEPAAEAHIADTVAAHLATAISFAPTGTVAATTVQAAIAEVATEAVAEPVADAHIADAFAAHAATAISFAPTGTIAATTVQAAIAEVATEQGEVNLGTTQTASFTLTLAMKGQTVPVSSASAVVVTIPTNATAAFATKSWIQIDRMGTGSVTIAAASGVTIRNPSAAATLRVQYSSAVLRKLGTDEWLLTGDLG